MALAVIASFLLGFAGFRILIGKADRTRGVADDRRGGGDPR
jgi:hypothetical protein